MAKTIQNRIITVGKTPIADFNTADYLANGGTEWSAIKAAYDSLALTGGVVRILNSSTPYLFNNGAILGQRISLKSNVTIEGETYGKVTIKGTAANDHLFYNVSTNGSNVIDNATFENIIFDLDNITNGSGIGFIDTINSGCINCSFKNGATGGVFVRVSVENPASPLSGFFGKDNFMTNCIYDTHQGSLEMLLIINQENFIDINSTFKNKGTVTTGVMLGIGQNCLNTKIINPKFINCNGFNYFADSCKYIYLENVYASNTGCVLQGANNSANIIFGPVGGVQRAIGLTINGFTAIGGVNSTSADTIRLGAITDYNIKLDYIEAYRTGIQFTRGEGLNNATATKGKISFGTMKNLNPLNSLYDFSTAILFTKAGKYDLFIEGGEVYDNRSTPFSIQPVFFEGNEQGATATATVTGGVITGFTGLIGGLNYPPSSTLTVLIGLPGVTVTGTGAVLTATTNASGVVTAFNIINGGTGYASLTVRAEGNNIYTDIRISNTNLIPYSGRDSIKKSFTVNLQLSTVSFNTIRGAVKGELLSYYNEFITNPTRSGTVALPKVTSPLAFNTINIVASGTTQILPNATLQPNSQIIVKKLATGTVTIATTSGQLVDNAVPLTMSNPNQTNTYVSDGTGWIII